eukprot:g76592.t1
MKTHISRRDQARWACCTYCRRIRPLECREQVFNLPRDVQTKAGYIAHNDSGVHLHFSHLFQKKEHVNGRKGQGRKGRLPERASWSDCLSSRASLHFLSPALERHLARFRHIFDPSSKKRAINLEDRYSSYQNAEYV